MGMRHSMDLSFDPRQAGRPVTASPGRSPGRLPDGASLLKSDKALQALTTEMEELKEGHANEMAKLKSEHETRLAALDMKSRASVETLRENMQGLVKQIKKVSEAQVQEGLANLDRQANQQLRLIDQLGKRLQAIEVQHQLLKDRSSKDASTACSATERMRHVEAISDAGQEIQEMRRHIQTLNLDKQQAEAASSLMQITEAAHRRQAEEATGRAARCREELIKYVEELHNVLGSNAVLQRETLAQGEQVAAAEEAIQVLRFEVTSLRRELLELRTSSLDSKLHSKRDLMKIDEVQTDAWSEKLFCELGVINGSLKDAALEAQYLEQQSRVLLETARREQLASQRALLHQMRRMQALEAMRLSDLQELIQLERRTLSESAGT
ncbi:hypothetical protein CEUSTIGMA_g8810.t1 [Chlamydomonas eustigma]|uniref:Uncharacterized protein n=1 Tax=Chlamydomonas eustigma TaxID=1157962 RepID=A0A250XEM7_9CHLO|nr:hypothetical protein CEUSTIGMA_g8810.t1 [Chlamydomonas eustigma]|eukprot:GAX81379.1 hypothetical protein CEUSTIGMA_g8810.t1 [Chlamydomonas eustigma]